MLRKIAIAGVAALSLAACTQQERNIGTGAAVGGGLGAAVGAVATGSTEGALVGAAIGAGTGAVIGAVAERPGYCYARDQYGQTIVIECPRGYR